MSTTLNIVRGESVTIAISLPLSKMTQVQEVQVYVGKTLKAKLSDNTLIATIDSNVFLMKLSSSFTNTLLNSNLVTVAVDYSDLGIDKIPSGEALNLFVQNTNNLFVNDSVSSVVNATIVLTIQDNELIQNTTIATIYRGYNTLELYQIENNDFTLTREDMLEAQNKMPYRVVQVVNVQDGDIIEHNLGGIVLCQVVESGQIQGGVYGEYLDDNKVTIRTPFFEDLVNTTYTGYAIVTLLEDVYSRSKVISVTDIEDGDTVTHNLNGSVLMQYIQNGQIQGGFYGQFNNTNSVIFKTPSLEGQTFTGIILCTKLS